MPKRRKAAPAPSRATLKRLPKLSKGAVAMLIRVYEGRFYPTQFPEPTGFMKELVEAGLVVSQGRATLLKSCYVPAGTVEPVLEKIPPMPNWLHQVYVARSFDHILPRVKKSKSDASKSRA